MSQTERRRRFCLVLVRPSHYDDDGYVIRWVLSSVPSNSLAVLYGLAQECCDRQVLGPDVDFEIHALDETNTAIRPDRIARLIERADEGLVMLVGVQSNQFPRALDIAAPLRQRGLQVAIGGFHVSGTLAMLADRDPDVRRAEEMGLSLFAGEAEGRLEQVLRDAWNRSLQPLYNYLGDPPELDGAPLPLLPATRVKRTYGALASLDTGRGCPFQCSFCTIINVQGRRSRYRSADDVEQIVRANVAKGLCKFFITDDNFARNRNWEAILDRLIHLREVDGLTMNFIIQVDTQCHKVTGFIEKAARAGVKRVYIGLENIDPDNLAAVGKKQNHVADYRRMLLAWKAARVVTYCGYILGFPQDTPEAIERNVRVVREELPVDILEFFYLTPLPGSADHRALRESGAWLDPDLNRYDLNHRVTEHPLMSGAEWERVYDTAWHSFYAPEHVEALLRRQFATGCSPGKLLFLIVWFKGCHDIEHIHPVEGGLIRLRGRGERRPGWPTEPAWRFYPRDLLRVLRSLLRWGALYLRLRLVYLRLKRDPARFEYTDAALRVDEESPAEPVPAVPAA